MTLTDLLIKSAKNTKKYLKNDPRGLRGGGVKKMCFFQNFCLYYLGGHAKFQNPTICSSVVLVTVVTREQENKRSVKNNENSASTDGGPRSQAIILSMDKLNNNTCTLC